MPMISPGRSGNADKLLDALASRTSHVVHLTHNDLDAVGADAIHRMAYGGIFTIFCSVGNFRFILEKVASLPGKGDLLSISDIGFQTGMEEKIDQAKKKGWRIEWRDHHRWQKEEIDHVARRIDLLHVDTEVCACGIAARDLRPGDPVAAEVALVVCDYDLWKNEEPRAAILARVVSREENRDHVRDCLVKGIFSDPFIEEQFRIIQREMEEDIEKSLHKTRVFENRHRIAVAPQYGYPSETAAAIRNTFHSDIEVLVYPSGRFSIRSAPPVSHVIAREFRGGGHAHAAGGSFDFSLLDRVAFLLFHSTRQIRRMVSFAESIEG